MIRLHLPAPDLTSKLCLALAATDTARAVLSRYALATDLPHPAAVSAADHLDAARAFLAIAMTQSNANARGNG